MVKFLACLLLICKVEWYRQENKSFGQQELKQQVRWSIYIVIQAKLTVKINTCYKVVTIAIKCSH